MPKGEGHRRTARRSSLARPRESNMSDEQWGMPPVESYDMPYWVRTLDGAIVASGGSFAAAAATGGTCFGIGPAPGSTPSETLMQAQSQCMQQNVAHTFANYAPAQINPSLGHMPISAALRRIRCMDCLVRRRPVMGTRRCFRWPMVAAPIASTCPRLLACLEHKGSLFSFRMRQGNCGRPRLGTFTFR